MYYPKCEPLDTVQDVKVNKIEIDPSQVQVRADAEEIQRRIQSYIARKRAQVNNINIHEFCNPTDDSESSSCARVDAILIRRKDSKSHVKVHRVVNRHGPQTTRVTSCLDSQNSNQDSTKCHHPLLEDRLIGPEKFLGVNKPVPRDIYQRIKNIEDRIEYLESISPEYKDFYMVAGDLDGDRSCRRAEKRAFSTAEVDSKLVELEAKYIKKIK